MIYVYMVKEKKKNAKQFNVILNALLQDTYQSNDSK